MQHKQRLRIAAFLAAFVLVLSMRPVPTALAAPQSLKLGMSGSDVKTLQTHLVKRGYLKAADGKFGSGTQKAVKLFQTQCGLAADGVAGAKTQSLLFNLTGTGKTNQTMKFGTKSSQVTILQKRLAALGYFTGAATNYFGNATKASLIKFQKKAGLKADGVAGPRTLIKLYSQSAPVYMTKGEKVVEYAKNFLGVKYVYGRADPDVGFDCSGLVYYVYKHFDVTVSRSAAGMVSVGTEVALKNAKPGDILCFGTSLSSVGHVGIYVGNNRYIHAPQTGEVVKIEVLKRSVATVRRIFTKD